MVLEHACCYRMLAGWLRLSSPSLLLQVDWAGLGVEVMLECSGKFLTREKLQPFFNRVGVGAGRTCGETGWAGAAGGMHTWRAGCHI